MIKHFTTSVFILDQVIQDFKVLLIHHKKFNKWMVPGGHIEHNENPIEASRREVLEETGVRVSFITFKHLDSLLLPNDSKSLLPPEYFFEQTIPQSTKEKEHFHLDFTYLSIYKSGELLLNNNETIDLKWVNISDIENIEMFDGTKKVIYNIRENIKVNHPYKII